MTTIMDLLDKRHSNYGSFVTQAYIAQQFKEAARLALVGKNMRPYQVEALEMILHKVSRILNGDPDYADSWTDIAGYAQLVIEQLNKNYAEKNENT